MTAKEFLSQYLAAERKAKLIRAEYEAQRQEIDTLRTSLEGDGGRTMEISRPVERMVMKLTEKAEELKTAEAEAIRIRQEVVDVILTVPDVSGKILYERFVLLKPWSEVAEAVGYQRRQVHRLYVKGLEDVARKI